MGCAKWKDVFLRCADCTDLDLYHTFAKSHLGICSTLMHSVVSNDSVSICAADLGLHCPHMLKDMFSNGLAHLKQRLFWLHLTTLIVQNGNVPGVAWWLTYFSLETLKRVIGKQCRPRSDAAECSIWSGSQLFTNSYAISHVAWHT